ncbi:tnf receptor-associated factor [Anaeramoeba flamelloides]|uniref:Tnf receptor-associated factor n=1 Tax=Anaeramoeba flamelloides TaxID=1746091 RepID=A0AAV7YQV3_9EUKA|nr:tnf receptor-associated factor [Anaeramoeba flamelloides]
MNNSETERKETPKSQNQNRTEINFELLKEKTIQKLTKAFQKKSLENEKLVREIEKLKDSTNFLNQENLSLVQVNEFLEEEITAFKDNSKKDQNVEFESNKQKIDLEKELKRYKEIIIKKEKIIQRKDKNFLIFEEKVKELNLSQEKKRKKTQLELKNKIAQSEKAFQKQSLEQKRLLIELQESKKELMSLKEDQTKKKKDQEKDQDQGQGQVTLTRNKKEQEQAENEKIQMLKQEQEKELDQFRNKIENLENNLNLNNKELNNFKKLEKAISDLEIIQKNKNYLFSFEEKISYIINLNDDYNNLVSELKTKNNKLEEALKDLEKNNNKKLIDNKTGTDSKNNEISQLKNQIENLKQNMETQANQNDELLKRKNNEIEELKLNSKRKFNEQNENYLELQNINQNLENKLKKKRQENVDLQSQLEKNDDAILKLEFEKQEINDYLVIFYNQFKKIEETNQKNHEKMKSVQSNFELKSLKISNLYTKLDLIQKNLFNEKTNNLNLELISNNKDNEIENDKEKLRKELEVIKKENIEMENKLSEAELKNNELLSQCNKKEEKIKKLKSNLQKMGDRINQKDVNSNDYQFELKERNKEISELKLQIEDLKNEIDNLNFQLNEENNEKNSFQKKYLQTKDQFNQNLRSIQQKLNEKEKKITKLSTKIDGLNNDKEDHLSKIENLNQHLSNEKEMKGKISHLIRQYLYQFSNTIEKPKNNSLKEYLLLKNSYALSKFKDNSKSDNNTNTGCESNISSKDWLIKVERQLYDLQQFFKNTVYKLKKNEIRNSLLKESCLGTLTNEQLSKIRDSLHKTQEEQLNEQKEILLEKEQQIRNLNNDYSSIISKNRILIGKINNLQNKLFLNRGKKIKNKSPRKYSFDISEHYKMKRKQSEGSNRISNENQNDNENNFNHKCDNNNIFYKYFEQNEKLKPLSSTNRKLVKMEFNNKL